MSTPAVRILYGILELRRHRTKMAHAGAAEVLVHLHQMDVDLHERVAILTESENLLQQNVTEQERRLDELKNETEDVVADHERRLNELEKGMREEIGRTDSTSNGVEFEPYAAVMALLHRDDCKRKCLRGKVRELEQFLRGSHALSRMAKHERIVSALRELHQHDSVSDRRRRGNGTRHRFPYRVPFVGNVCWRMFCACYGISAPTLYRYRKHIAVQQENGCDQTSNLHAKQLDS